MASKNHTCVLCGNQLPEGSHGNKKYCSYKCGTVAWAKSYHALQPECTCLVCEKVYRPKSPERNKCCSRECGFAFSAFKRSARTTGARVFVRVKIKKKTKPKTSTDYYKPIIEAVCRNCGCNFLRNDNQSSRYMCSTACLDEAKARTRRKGRSKRDALERGAKTADIIDPLKVFERDGWKCAICKKRTPKAKRGTIDANAPELDHIISLANGGKHSWDNVQCACRQCNSKKGSSNYGQLNLFPKAV